MAICAIVYPEFMLAFDDRALLNDTLRQVNVSLSPITTDIAYDAYSPELTTD